MNTKETNIDNNMFHFNPFEKGEMALISQDGFVYGKPGSGKSFAGDFTKFKDAVLKVSGRNKSNNWRKRHHLPMRRNSGKKKRGFRISIPFIDEFHLFFSEPTARKLAYATGGINRKETKVVQSLEELCVAYGSQKSESVKRGMSGAYIMSQEKIAETLNADTIIIDPKSEWKDYAREEKK